MPRTSLPQTLTRLTTLAQSITAEDTAEAPHLERPHAKLLGLLEEIRKLLTRRDFYQAHKQEATRKAHERIRQARATANLLRKGLQEHYGSDNEELERFAIKPFRGRKRAKKSKGSR
jgi:CHAD domain-containing protein